MPGLGKRQLKDRFHKGKLLPYRVYFNTARQRFIFFVYDKEARTTKKIKSFNNYADAVTYACHYEFMSNGVISTRNKYIAEKYGINIFVQTELLK
jgi:hypothetical protein